MSDLVNKVAELLNAPVDLVQRSAEARAQASGVSVDDVLNSWAGGESVAASAAPAPKEEAPVEEVKEEAPVAAAVATKQIKKSVSFINETMSIKTNSDTILPKWLNFSFVIIPLFILIGLISSSNTQECGERGMLDVDRKSQQAVNCDGSPYEGRGVAATNTINYIAIGQEVYAGAGACAGCHGGGGGGGSEAHRQHAVDGLSLWVLGTGKDFRTSHQIFSSWVQSVQLNFFLLPLSSCFCLAAAKFLNSCVVWAKA